MSQFQKPFRNLSEYATQMDREAGLAEARADHLCRAALKTQMEGDLHRAEVMWYTCRKIRVQAIFDRSRAAAARARDRQ